MIIDAIKESRKIFQRMNSYAICRIAETLRVLLFMTLVILIFDFYPLTAVMIVMLALLNDGKKAEIALRELNAKLESRVEERAAEMRRGRSRPVRKALSGRSRRGKVHVRR